MLDGAGMDTTCPIWTDLFDGEAWELESGVDFTPQTWAVDDDNWVVKQTAQEVDPLEGGEANWILRPLAAWEQRVADIEGGWPTLVNYLKLYSEHLGGKAVVYQNNHRDKKGVLLKTTYHFRHAGKDDY